MKDKKFSLSRRIKSFGPAFRGLRAAFQTQHNLWIHLLAVIVVVSGGFFFKLSRLEWGLVVLALGLVLAAELINTAIEGLVDLASPDYNRKAGFIKDVAAGAVLLAAIIALVIGTLIFLPKITHTFHLPGLFFGGAGIGNHAAIYPLLVIPHNFFYFFER